MQSFIETTIQVQDYSKALIEKNKYYNREDFIQLIRSKPYSELQQFVKQYIRIVDRYNTLLFTVYDLKPVEYQLTQEELNNLSIHWYL